MHPYAKHSAQKTSRSRVGHLLKSGGAAHSDIAADKKLFKELMAKHEASEMHAEGKKSGGRLDKYARGGRTKGKSRPHQVNIAIVAPHGRHPADAAATPGGPPPPPLAPPLRPPVAAGGPPAGLPPGLPPGGPPGLPPGMPPMKRGGKVKKFARGGKTYTGGGDTGVGRLQKKARYGLKPSGAKGK